MALALVTTPNGKSRPLTVVVPIEKIMKRAIRAVLQSIYDPEFLDTSHFRPGRGCHSALIRIRKEWGYSNWFLEFGISKCFHTIDRHRLIPILKEEIDGGKNSLFFRLIGPRSGTRPALHSLPRGRVEARIDRVARDAATRPPQYSAHRENSREGGRGRLVGSLRDMARDRGGGDSLLSGGSPLLPSPPYLSMGERGIGSRPSSVLLSAPLILSLGNIYLHKLDREIERIQQKHEIPIVQITVPHPDDQYALNLDRELNRREAGAGEGFATLTPPRPPRPRVSVPSRPRPPSIPPVWEIGGDRGGATRSGRVAARARPYLIDKIYRGGSSAPPIEPYIDSRGREGDNSREPGPTPTLSPEGIRICYARYADDFLLGIVGTVELLRVIQKRITHFLQSGLNGSAGFTTIAARSTVEFPGTVIRATRDRQYRGPYRELIGPYPYRNGGVGPRELEKRRRAKHRIHLTASHLRSAIHSKLEDLGRSIPIQQLCRRSEQLTLSIYGALDLSSHILGAVGHRSTDREAQRIRSLGRGERDHSYLPPQPPYLDRGGGPSRSMGSRYSRGRVPTLESPPRPPSIPPSIPRGGALSRSGGGPYLDLGGGRVAGRRAHAHIERGRGPPSPEISRYREGRGRGRRWPGVGRSPSRSAVSGSELTAGKSEESSKTQIKAPVRKILQRLRDRGIISRRRAWPTHVACLTNVGDEDIVNWFAGVAISLLSHYRCRDNFYQVRTIVDYQIRWSAIFTPAHKHKSSARKIILEYSRDLHIVNGGKTLAESPNSIELRKLGPDLDYLDTEHAYKTFYQVYIRYA